MGFLTILLIIIFVASALLLIGLVLLQDEGGDSLGGIFGGGGTTQIGNRQGNILTRATSILGVIFMASSFFLAFLNRTPDAGDIAAAAARLDQQEEIVEWWLVPEESDEDLNLDLDTGAIEPITEDPMDAGAGDDAVEAEDAAAGDQDDPEAAE